MGFQDIKDNLDQIQKESKSYIESNVAYYKLWGFKVMMKLSMMILKFFMILLFASLFIVFLSIGGAILIGNALGNSAYGFLIIAGVYLLLTLLIVLLKPKFVTKLLLKRFSEIFFND